MEIDEEICPSPSLGLRCCWSSIPFKVTLSLVLAVAGDGNDKGRRWSLMKAIRDGKRSFVDGDVLRGFNNCVRTSPPSELWSRRCRHNPVRALVMPSENDEGVWKIKQSG